MDTGDTDSANTGIAYSLSVTSASTNTSLVGLQDRFIINSVTGVISCEPINHEFNYDTIILTVTATDSGTNPGPLTDTATVTITVQVCQFNNNNWVNTQCSNYKHSGMFIMYNGHLGSRHIVLYKEVVSRHCQDMKFCMSFIWRFFSDPIIH